MEFRELKRLYMREQNLVEEWRKDYQVLKQQLNLLKSSTIRKWNIFVFMSKSFMTCIKP
jgi:hypothetical protein